MNSSSSLDGGNRRRRLDIIVTIMEGARIQGSGVEIMKRARLNSKQLRLYLDELVTLGLINVTKVDGQKAYLTSRKGLQFLHQYRTMKQLLD